MLAVFSLQVTPQWGIGTGKGYSKPGIILLPISFTDNNFIAVAVPSPLAVTHYNEHAYIASKSLNQIGVITGFNGSDTGTIKIDFICIGK